MQIHRRNPRRLALIAAAVLLATAGAAPATPDDPRPDAIQVAQATDAPPRELEPRYQPVPPPPKSSYNNSYIFAMTRGVADSTLAPAAKVFLYPLTLPLDLVLLPFAAIGGLFG